MPQNEKSGLEGLTVRDAVDRILAFNAKMHDVSATADVRNRARSARDDGLRLIDYWKTDPQRQSTWRNLVQALDFSDNVGRRHELEARLSAGEPVDVPASWLARTPRPVFREDGTVQPTSQDAAGSLMPPVPSSATIRLQNTPEGRGRATARVPLEDGTFEEFPVPDPRRFAGSRPDLALPFKIDQSSLDFEKFEGLPFEPTHRAHEVPGTDLLESLAFSIPFTQFVPQDGRDASRLIAHQSGQSPFRDTPNLHQDGKIIRQSREPGGFIGELFADAGFDITAEVGTLAAEVTDPDVIRAADVLYGEKLTDESGDYVIDSAGQRVNLYRPLAAGSTINTPDGPITLTEDAIEEIVNSRSGGKLGGSIVGHFYHDDMVDTVFGPMIVPKITGNPDTDRELMRDPVFLRAFQRTEDGGQEFQTMLFQSLTGVGEFAGVMKLTQVAGAAAKGTLAAGARTGVAQRMFDGFATRFAGTGVHKVYERVGAGMRNALTGGGGARATKVRAPMMNGDLAQIGEEVWYNTVNAAITGRESLLEGAISGTQEGISEYAFGSMARFSRRAAGPLLRKMTAKLANLPIVGRLGRAVDNAQVGDASALLAQGLDDEFSQRVVGRAMAKLQSRRGEIQAALANRYANAEVNGLLRSIKTQAAAEATVDAGLMGYMFGGYTEAIRAAQLDGKDFGALDFWTKVEYMREGLASPGAMGGAVAFAGVQGMHGLAQSRQPATMNLTAQGEKEISDTIEYIVNQAVRRPMQEDGDMAVGALAIVEPSVNEFLSAASKATDEEFSALLSEELVDVRGHPDGLFREVGGELIGEEVGRIYLKDGGPNYVAKQFTRLTGGELRALRREIETLPNDPGEDVNSMNAGRFLRELIDGELAEREAVEGNAEAQLRADQFREEQLQRAADFQDQNAPDIPPERRADPPTIPDSEVDSYFLLPRQWRNVEGEAQIVHQVQGRNILVSERPTESGIRYDVVGRSKWRPISGSPEGGFESLAEAKAFALAKTRVAESPLARLVAQRSQEPVRGTAEFGRPDTQFDPSTDDTELASAISAAMREKQRARSSLAEEAARTLSGEQRAGYDFVAPSKLTAPETAATVDAQMDAMRAGRKPAVLISPGTDVPKLKRGERRVQIDEGLLILPSKGSDRVIADLKSGKLGLGDVLGYGVSDREASDQVVTAVDALGRTVVDIQAEPTGDTIQAAKRLAGEGGEVMVRSVEDAMRERRRGQTPQDPLEKTEQIPFGAGLNFPSGETLMRNRRRIYDALRQIPGNELKTEAELVDGFLRQKDVLSSKALNNRVRTAEKMAESALAGRARIDAVRKPRLFKLHNKSPEQVAGEAGQAVSNEGGALRAAAIKQVEAINAAEVAAEQAVEANESEATQQSSSRSRFWSEPEMAQAFRSGADMVTGQDSVGAKTQGTKTIEAAEFMISHAADKQRIRAFAAGMLVRLGIPNPTSKRKGEGSADGIRKLGAVANITGLTFDEVVRVQEQLRNDARAMVDVVDAKSTTLQRFLGTRHKNTRTRELLEAIALGAPQTETKSGRSQVLKPERVREVLDRALRDRIPELAREMQISEAGLEATVYAEGGLIDRVAKGYGEIGRTVRDLRGRLMNTIATNFGLTKQASSFIKSENMTVSEAADIVIEALTGRGQEMQTKAGIGRVVQESVLAGESGPGLDEVAVAGAQGYGVTIDAQQAVRIMREDSGSALQGDMRVDDLNTWIKTIDDGRAALLQLYALNAVTDAGIIPVLGKTEFDPEAPWDAFYKTSWPQTLMRRLAEGDKTVRGYFTRAVDQQGNPMFENEAAAIKAWELAQRNARSAVQSAQELAVRWAEDSNQEDGGLTQQNQVEALFNAAAARAARVPLDATTRQLLDTDTPLFPTGALNEAKDGLREGVLEDFQVWMHEHMTEFSKLAKRELDLADQDPILLYGGITVFAPLGFNIDASTLAPVTGHGRFSVANLYDKAKRTKTYGRIADEFSRFGDWWNENKTRRELAGSMGLMAANFAQHLGRGQRSGFLTKMVKAANWDYRRLNIAEQHRSARFLDKMGLVLDKVRELKLSPEAQKVIVKAIRNGAHLRVGTVAEWEKIFGKGTAPMYDVMGEIVGLFNSMGRELVNEGLITPEQFQESRYVPRLYDKGGLVHREALEHLNAGRSPISGRERHSTQKDLEEMLGRELGLEEVLPIATIQEAKRIQEMGTLNRLVESGNVLTQQQFDELTPYEQAFWLKAAEPAGGGRALGQSEFEYEQEVLTTTELDAVNRGEMSLEEKKKILRRRKFATPQQARLQGRLERELEAMDTGEAPDTPQKREMIDAMLNGYVSRNTLFELDMLLDQTDPEAGDVGPLQSVLNIWRRQKTIQNPKHWFMNIYSSVLTNWATGRVSGLDFVRSLMTGTGVYAQSGNELSLWWDWVQDGRPDTTEFTVEDRDAIARVEEFTTALGSNTFGQLITEPVNMSEYLSDIARIGITETHTPVENSKGIADTVTRVISRRLPWQMRFDEKWSQLAGHPNPRMRAEALRALDGLYQMHEMFFKYAAALNGMKSSGMTMQKATEWGAVGTADYADRNPLIYKLTSRFNFGMTMEERAATARAGQRIGVGNVAIQLRGRNAVSYRRARRWAGKLLAGPFWNYRWQMVPALLIESPLSTPLTWAAAFTSFGVVTQMMSGMDEGDHEDLMEALAGLQDWNAVPLPDEEIERMKEQYGDVMVGGYFNSANSARDRIPLSKMLDFRRLMTQDLENLPGPKRGGRSTVVDVSDGMLGPQLMRGVAREGVLRTMTKDLPVALLSGMALTTSSQMFDMIKGRTDLDRADQMVSLVHDFAKETNSFLGGGIGGSLFSRESQNLQRTLSQDGRTLSESLRGIRRPLLERMTPDQKAKLAVTEFLLPTRDVPRGTPALPGEGEGLVGQMQQQLKGGPLGPFIDPSRPVSGTPDTQRFQRFKSRLTGQLSDFAADAYIEALNSTAPEELDLSTSGVLRGWLGLEQDLSIDQLDGQYVLRDQPRTEIGKFLHAQAGGDPAHEKAMIGVTIEALGKWSGKVGETLEGLMNKRRLDPAIVRRVSLAMFKNVDEGRGVMEFIAQRVLEDKDTENYGVYYELYRSSGLASKGFDNSADRVLQRKLNAAFRESGAEDLEFPNTETRAREVRRVLGPAAPDIAPNLFLQDLFPRRNQ